MFEYCANGMKVLASDVDITLDKYKSTVHIRKRDVLIALRAAAERASTNDITVEPDIDNNSNAQDENDWHNVFRHAAIGVKDGIAEGIIKIIKTKIRNPILWMMDNINFKLVDQYQIHQLFTAITEKRIGQSRQTSGDISSTSWGQFSTVGRQL